MSSGHLHPQYNLRWPEELRDKVAASAKKHNRSMNADIVARLEASFSDENSPISIANKFTDPDFTRRLERSFNLLSDIEELIESTDEDEKVITVTVKKKIRSVE